MKKALFIYLTILGITAIAQKNHTDQTLFYPQETPKNIESEKPLYNAKEVKHFLKSHLPLLPKDDFSLLSEIKSPHGIHYTFIQNHEGKDVYQAHVKVNTMKNGVVTSIFSSFENLEKTKIGLWPSVPQEFFTNNSAKNITEQSHVWIKQGDSFVKALRISYHDNNHLYHEKIYNINNEIIIQRELSNHFAPVDTTAQALVYKPDPATRANKIYGAPYIDNNDATNPSLDASRDTAIIELSYDNNTFTLENKYVKIVDISLPLIDPATSTTPYFFYDRSQSGFEDVNVLYHITEQQKYIQSLGFTNIVDYQIEVDCHGFGGADNSTFTFGTSPPSITFGTGGVDDAEDSDVIIHEYSHAIMHSASPNTNSGQERNSMDEGFGDFMAVSYANTHSPFHTDWVFKWDGHNEFWDGRLVISSAIYPQDLLHNLYKDAPIWSSALLRIERNTSREIATTIAIEAAYSFTRSMTMAQAADLILQTDDIIYNGDHYAEICWIFKDKGLVSSCTVNKPSDLLGVNTIASIPMIQLKNTEMFSRNLEPLIVSAVAPFTVAIYTINGMLYELRHSSADEISISPNEFSAGTYIYKVTNKSYVKSFKVTKF